jgi:Zn finger protein HypA/HybF involved in hydrogenase expression
MRFIITCAWCNKYMGVKIIDEDSEEPVITQTMCPECKARIKEEIAMYLKSIERAEN